MSLFTDPPHFTGSPGYNVVGSQPLISGRVPLSSQPGVLGSQTVFAGGYLTVCADRATAAGHPGFDLRPPRVSFFTDPPDHAMAAGQDLHGSETAVSSGMPLTGQLGKTCCQIILTWLYHFPGTNRAAASTSCSGIHRCLPNVLLLTPPPYFALAAPGDEGRSERQIFIFRPLSQQLLPPFPFAENVQAFSHGQTSFDTESTFRRNINYILEESRVIIAGTSKKDKVSSGF